LTLLDTNGDLNEAQVCCKLEHAYLDDPPQYHALSYCWGDPHMTVPIQVNGKPKRVTTNLEAALRELRAQKIEKVWVDALCINQQDPTERGLQVMRMGLIYSRALKVLAWLGPEAENSTSAMNRLGNLDPALAETRDDKPIRDLFKRPYWKRVCKSNSFVAPLPVETYLCM
jgi:hypothetical protein